MTPLATVPATDCWNRIGVRGDGSCPTLAEVVHCQNCPVFAAAGRRFLDAPAPPGYRDEWTARLASIDDEDTCEGTSVLVFRLADEWLALPVPVLVEVTPLKPVRRVPHRTGVLAGVVNMRGELTLCAHLGKVLGIANGAISDTGRMLVVRRDSDRWAFAVAEVDRVHRVPNASVGRPPATVARAASHLTRGVFPLGDRAVGLIDEGRLFDTLRAKLR